MGRHVHQGIHPKDGDPTEFIMTNCTTFLDVNARFGDKPALIHPSTGDTCSYRELLDEVNRIGNGLSGLGLCRGDCICIYLESSIEYIQSYLAIWRIGCVAVPLNHVLTGPEVLYALENARATAIITDESGSRVIKEIRDQAPHCAHVVVVGDARRGETGWDALRRSPSDSRALYCDSDTLCQIQYTSGTTGSPKGAMLTHGNWMAAMDAEREALGLTKDDVYLGIYPMAHVGVSWGIAALRGGATWVIMERFNLEDYIALVSGYGASVVAGMPPVIHALLEEPEGTEQHFSATRVMISGGGPLHPSIWKAFYERYHIAIVNAYGLSETVVIGTGTAIRPEDYEAADEFYSVGHPVGFSEVKIVDVEEPTLELGIDQDGEIALRGPGVATGYWAMPEETAAVFLPDGWFLTGDIGHLDQEGRLVITDRKKDMIVMSGWKIYPTEVEKILVQHPNISDAAVFGAPDIQKGEIPVAAIVPSGPEPLTYEEIRQFCRNQMAGYKIPRKVVMVESLPRVHGWKLLRRELRDRYVQGLL
jgi:long-chain acyl-CoA synthetase